MLNLTMSGESQSQSTNELLEDDLEVNDEKWKNTKPPATAVHTQRYKMMTKSFPVSTETSYYSPRSVCKSTNIALNVNPRFIQSFDLGSLDENLEDPTSPT